MSIGDLTGQVPITANDDGTLSTAIMLDESGKPRKFREVSANTWQAEGDRQVLVASMKDGKVDYLLSNAFPQILTIQPVSAWNSMYWRLPLLGFTVLMLLLTVVFWPVKAILRWRYRQPFELSGRAATVYRATRIVALIDLLFIGGWMAFLTSGLADLDTFAPTHDWMLRLIQLIGVVGVVGTVVVVLNFWNALNDPARRWWTKASDGLLVLAAVALVFFTFSYHLISLSLNY
jgi:hypothetical protein